MLPNCQIWQCHYTNSRELKLAVSCRGFLEYFLTSEPPCLLSVNTHVFKVDIRFAEKIVFAKCCTVLAHSTQINKLTDAYTVNCIIVHCTYAPMSLLVQLCYGTTVPK